MFRKWKKGGHLDPHREKLKNELYAFKTTVEHGFPNRPCALAYDPILKLMAIGSKSGAIKIFGQPGVEFTSLHADDNQVVQLHFIPGEGRIISVLDDNTMRLWELCTSKEDQQGAQGLVEVGATQLATRPGANQITTLTIRSSNDLMWVGTEDGGIYSLTLPDLEVREQGNIHQDQVMQSVPDHYKTGKPLGLVEAIVEHPKNPSQILIGYNRGLAVLWDDTSQSVESFYLSEKGIESLSWLSNSNEFMSAHSDGCLCTWRLGSSSPHTSYTPYGPFPCKAITKILWKSSRDAYKIFSGGMPRANYGDRHCVSVIQGSNHVTFDFTSRVIDFFVICKNQASSDWEDPQFLIVLAEEEVVAIDLTQEDWPSLTPPYLGSPHASAITCSSHAEDLSEAVWEKIQQASESLKQAKSKSPWPITGGVSLNEKSSVTRNILLTGHEDGSIKLWDVSTVCMKPILKLQTSHVFITDSDAGNDGDGYEEQFPPFRKVGEFDPYSDDPRLSLRKVTMCPTSGTIVAGGTAGQVIVFILSSEGIESQITGHVVDILEGRTDFSWKGHGKLQTKDNHLNMEPGYQVGNVIQCEPPAGVTALSVCSNWGLIGVGTGHGFALFDYLQNKNVLARCTLEAGDNSAMEGHFSRSKSFKMSLRQSIRRIRGSFKGGGRGSSRRRASGRRRYGRKDMSQRLQEANAALVDEEETASGSGWSPAATGQRRVEARSSEDALTGMVRATYFATTYIRDTVSCTPTFWAGTNSGGIFVFALHVPDYSQRQDQEVSSVVGKHIQLMHRAPVVNIAVVDGYGNPVHAAHGSADAKPSNGSAVGKTSPLGAAHHSLIISSEEQVKVFALPKIAAKRKFKLTAFDGSLIRKVEYAKFVSSKNSEVSEYSLVCLTNLGEIHIFSQLPSIRPQETYNCIGKDDPHGIASVILTTQGQGMYLLSPSEYARFTLSTSNVTESICRVKTSRDGASTETADGHQQTVQVVVEDKAPISLDLTPKKSPSKKSRSGGGAAVVATQPSSPKTPLLCDHDDEDDDDDARHMEKHESVLEEAERTLAEAGDSIRLTHSDDEEVNVQDILGAVAAAEEMLQSESQA